MTPQVSPRQLLQIPVGSRLEILLQFAAILLALWIALAYSGEIAHLHYLYFMPLTWIALRHGLPGAILALFLLIGGTWAVVLLAEFHHAWTDLLIFMVTLVFVGFSLGMTVTAYRRSRREVARQHSKLKSFLGQLRRQAERVQQIVDTVPDGVVMVGDDGRIAVTNPRAEQYLSILAPDYLNCPLTNLGNCSLASLLVDPAPECPPEATAGQQSFEIRSRPLPTAQRPGQWVLVITDVTEERANQRYQQAQDRLATVGELAAGIAHNFNNYLGIVGLHTELLMRSSRLSTKEHSRLNTILERTQSAAKLVRQIVDFSGQSVLTSAPLDLVVLVKSTVQLLGETLPEHIEIEVEHEAPSLMVRADPTRIEQAIVNLAANARDAMPHGGCLTFELAALNVEPDAIPPLPGMARGDWIRLRVGDTGEGIKPANLSRLFEPFFTTKGPDAGSGLGLAQVHGVIKQHQGAIDVASEEGRGTVFTIYLPRLATPEPDVSSDKLTAVSAPPETTILVVEDDPEVRTTVTAVLDGLGYPFLMASTGNDALRLLEEKNVQVDLVLSDMIMPEMGGLELRQALLRKYPGMKVLFMTGYPLGTDGDLVNGEGQIDWIQKPFSITNLAQKLGTVIRIE